MAQEGLGERGGLGSCEPRIHCPRGARRRPGDGWVWHVQSPQRYLSLLLFLPLPFHSSLHLTSSSLQESCWLSGNLPPNFMRMNNWLVEGPLLRVPRRHLASLSFPATWLVIPILPPLNDRSSRSILWDNWDKTASLLSSPSKPHQATHPSPTPTPAPAPQRRGACM